MIEAENMYKRALERCKKTHGPNHPEIEKMGRNVRALIGKEKIWGAEHRTKKDVLLVSYEPPLYYPRTRQVFFRTLIAYSPLPDL